MKHFLILALCLCLILPLFSSAEDMDTPMEDFSGFHNPFLSTANDPWIVKGDDGFYYYCFSSGGLFIARSRTITGLPGAVLDPSNCVIFNVPDGQTDVWAPELHHYRGSWYLFYAADFVNDNRQHRMYCAKSLTDDPMGGWNPAVKMELPEDQWAIDGTLFPYDDGRLFFIWSGWKDEAEGTSTDTQRLYLCQLNPDNPAEVIGDERIEIAHSVYPWEKSVKPIQEGPAMVRSPEGDWCCIYAADFSITDNYAEGVLLLKGDPSDADAWIKQEKPLLQSNPEEGIYGPGHASVVKSPDGTEDWIIYHTAKKSGSAWNRSGRMQRITWENGIPTAEPLISNSTLVPLPSGEEPDRMLLRPCDGKLTGGMHLQDGCALSTEISDTIEFLVTMEETQVCTITLRHSGSITDDGSLYAMVKIGKAGGLRLDATLSGEGQFVSDSIRLKLKKGQNRITLKLTPGLMLDSVVIDFPESMPKN